MATSSFDINNPVIYAVLQNLRARRRSYLHEASQPRCILRRRSHRRQLLTHYPNNILMLNHTYTISVFPSTMSPNMMPLSVTRHPSHTRTRNRNPLSPRLAGQHLSHLLHQNGCAAPSSLLRLFPFEPDSLHPFTSKMLSVV